MTKAGSVPGLELFLASACATMPDRPLTLKNECRDFFEWHRGRAPYVLWAIAVDSPAVRRRVAGAAAAMADLLLASYRRQPHVTLALCGFPADLPGSHDEFSAACLARQVAALRRTLAGMRSFELRLGELATFDSAPYLAVADEDGAIAAIRQALTSAQRPGQGSGHWAGDERPHVYVPHVTVGLYRDRWPLAEVHARIRRHAKDTPLAVRIDRVSLLAYDPREIGGALTPWGEFSLDDGMFSLLPGTVPEWLLCDAQNC